MQDPAIADYIMVFLTGHIGGIFIVILTLCRSLILSLDTGCAGQGHYI